MRFRTAIGKNQSRCKCDRYKNSANANANANQMPIIDCLSRALSALAFAHPASLPLSQHDRRRLVMPNRTRLL